MYHILFYPLIISYYYFCAGLFFILPCIDSYQKVDLRTVSFDVPPQEVLTVLSRLYDLLFEEWSIVTVLLVLIITKYQHWLSDSDQRQCDCCSGCSCLLPHQWPNHVSHQCGKGWSVNSSACTDNTAKFPWHQKSQWNFGRPWRDQPCYAGTDIILESLIYVSWK